MLTRLSALARLYERAHASTVYHKKITHTTSSISSLIATAIKMSVRGTAVVNRPVGETPGICCVRGMCVCVCVCLHVHVYVC